VTNKQANILFIPSSISGIVTERQDAPSQHSYYQKLIYSSLARGIYTREGIQSLGRQLAAIARHAYLARQSDVVETVSRVMLGLPLPDSLRSVARYYQRILLREHSPRHSLENLLEETSLPLAYRARVLQTLGGTYIAESDPNTATMLAIESLRIATDPNIGDLLSTVEGTRQLALAHGINGDHKQALAVFERLFPLVRAISKYYPAAYYDFLNGLAVELGEAGRVSEAQAALSIALASPFAPAYPEWTETRDEIAAKRQSASPSFVAVNRAPEVELSPQVEPQREPRRSRLRLSTRLASEKASFQRASIVIIVSAVVVHDGLSQIILDRVLTGIKPRAPPAVL
jgi:hypothetical protein